MSATSSPFTIETTPEHATLVLRGVQGIELAAELHAALLGLVPHPGEVRIEWTAAEHVDACVLQLLVAFRRAREAAGAAITIGPADRAVSEFLELGGFAPWLASAGNTR